jgi:ArsR family transcriptional regulator, arsenate/arsenite/antimonite-responsive transcriptional repressor
MTAAAGTPTDLAPLDAVDVLADPLRRRIVQALAEEQLCTCHLVEMTGAQQPTVSYHLKVLRDAGWVRPEPAGRYTYYQLDPGPLAALAEALGQVARRTAAAGRRPACD